MASSIVARKAGSSTVVVVERTRTSSPRPFLSWGKAALTILSALRDSPTPVSLRSMAFMGETMPIPKARTTNPNQPKMATLRWRALQ